MRVITHHVDIFAFYRITPPMFQNENSALLELFVVSKAPLYTYLSSLALKYCILTYFIHVLGARAYKPYTTGATPP